MLLLWQNTVVEALAGVHLGLELRRVVREAFCGITSGQLGEMELLLGLP